MTEKSSQAIKEFLGEAEEILENLSADLMELGETIEGGDTNPDLLNSIFRGAHSLKGLSGMFGFVDIADLSHQLESVLDGLRLGKLPLEQVLVETLFEALEILGRLVHGKGESADYTIDVGPVVKSLEGMLKGDGEQGRDNPFAALDIDPLVLDVLTEYEEHRLLENMKKGRNLFRVLACFQLTTFDTDLAEVTELLKKDGEVISTLPSSDGGSDDAIAFQILVGSPLSLDELCALVAREGLSVEGIGTKGKKPEVSAALPPARQTSVEPAAKKGDSTASMRSISRMVRVDIDKLDLLMNIVGELVIAKGTIGELSDRLKLEGHGLGSDLVKATRILERRLSELQKGVMEVRMVPISQLFDKMARVVRRMAGDVGKKIVLDIRGAETELDKLITEDLSDPLLHIIRNAIDHGIELPETRLAAGKPENGHIGLYAVQKGNHVVIEIHDDGRGIDGEKVRRKAIERGLIDESADLSQEEVFELILLPGFSTADKVSELSGRGVGMDVVKNNISALSGMIEISSRLGEGTTMVITLPITLAIIKALIIRVMDKEFAIPITSVMETLMVERTSVRTIEGREVIELRQSTLPLLRLAKLFNYQPVADDGKGPFFVVVVGMAEKRMGLVVDELLGQQDVVIKPLGNILSLVRGFAGAAELGNRKTILVLDVGSLMSESLRGELTLNV
ncbi:CheA signal transduction histidine kinase [Geoalkalibacter ferrihydriticus]|uniref:histidine kinase n=2 Tax=Geoalkalibacter ferrihydriticus TaxID=392333 RepID=A0A0C2HJX6_9BACT|nr:chemotaxis protein CheA [Geoalkalibacter ferrihydriticus]KIH77366.1 chemotaxis protein CheA [Geoalkalibacter ferrihydriticus DSM 17813]SDM18033.1 CheA signal transduction histidine kinase [Geoalkalibacter ferrihydriticus]